MGGRLDLDGGTLNLDGGTHPPYNLTTGSSKPANCIKRAGAREKAAHSKLLLTSFASFCLWKILNCFSQYLRCNTRLQNIDEWRWRRQIAIEIKTKGEFFT